MAADSANGLEEMQAAFAKAKSVVLYRLPNENEVHGLWGDAVEMHALTEVFGQTGFAFLPAVNSSESKPFFVIPDGIQSIPDWASIKLPEPNWPANAKPPYIANKNAYLAQASAMVSAFKSGGVKKAILSRIKLYEAPNFYPLETFNNLCKAYPAVMVYYVSIPGIGTWMGATPETLLRIKSGEAETVSLAGTQPDSGTDTAAVAWGDKERQEQQIVSDEIEGLIKQYFPATEIHINGPNTVSTGALLHLKTVFNWRLPKDFSALEAFTMALHPTPAIVGKPREAALSLIAKTETHDRGYYTGLIGPTDPHGLTHLFVNLRCMQLLPGQLALYVGGGLTKDSNPEAEWEETELKAQTLLRWVC